MSDPNPKQRYGDLKPAVHLVPPALTLGAAKALKEGAIKYGPYNWRDTKVELMTYIAGSLRHLYALLDGEDVDPESPTGKLHMEGLAANAAIMLDAWYGNFVIDNRPTKGPAPAMTRTPLTPPPGVPSFGKNEMPGALAEQLLIKSQLVADMEASKQRKLSL